MTSCCSICFDEEEEVLFECSNRTCSYKLCGPCVREAFKDSSGCNSSVCQFCQTPSALDMIKAVCGTGAIKAVERDMRSSIEFELKVELKKKDEATLELSEINSRATKIFNAISDAINLRCPRCKMVFHDYDGCNALICASPDCKAAFCAICLKDCGSDAHHHVGTHHGNLFDRQSFESSRKLRAKTVVDEALEKISNESFELKQLVRNHVDKAKLINQSGQQGHRSQLFLQKTKESLLFATKHDRLSLSNDPTSYRLEQQVLTREDLSPRCSFPDEFTVVMRGIGNNVYDITIEYTDEVFGKRIILPENIENERDLPNICALQNLVQNLKCSVIVFSGLPSMYQTKHAKVPEKTQLGDNEICVSIHKVAHDGTVLEECDDMNHQRLIVLGCNPNLRFHVLEKHVQKCLDSEIFFEPLQHLIGDGKAVPVFTEILRPIPNSQSELNGTQKKIAHPLCLKTAMEVAGPPGTGKTKTIVELVRAILECTDFDVIVLSERNGAINAIAEKFKSSCLEVNGERIKVQDPLVWLSVMTYGSHQTMGEYTKLFLLEKKLSYHPDLIKLNDKEQLLKEMSKSLTKEMRRIIATKLKSFGNIYDIYNINDICDKIEFDKETLNTPLLISRRLYEVISDLEEILDESKTNKQNLKESRVVELVQKHSVLLTGLLGVFTSAGQGKSSFDLDKKLVFQRLTSVHKLFKEVVKLDIFDEDVALTMYNDLAEVREEKKRTEARLKIEFGNNARLHMSTIGSSHKMPVPEETDLSDRFGSLSIDADNFEPDMSSYSEKKETIVIFDEAGCIPSYELLGLSRLGRNFKAILLVGDEHQLPPYDSSQGGNFKKDGTRGGGSFRRQQRTDQRREKLKSLLDVSSLYRDEGKLMLTQQYRVPRDIADILNARVYRGSYNTSPHADVPRLGLNVCDVEEDRNPRRKYVNSNEVEYAFQLLDGLNLTYSDVLIITPYKNQQREFEFQIKKRRMDATKYPVLTIDQCQGQEADVVILSLVRKPTKFLNLNRLNVALSRVRQHLYVLVDKHKLREACRDSNWEARLLAGDLLDFGETTKNKIEDCW